MTCIISAALLDGTSRAGLWPKIWTALALGGSTTPPGQQAFERVEGYAKRTAKLA